MVKIGDKVRIKPIFQFEGYVPYIDNKIHTVIYVDTTDNTFIVSNYPLWLTEGQIIKVNTKNSIAYFLEKREIYGI